MKNKDQWRHSKFVFQKGKLRAFRNSSEVLISSRLMVDLVAKFYDTYLIQYARSKLLDLG